MTTDADGLAPVMAPEETDPGLRRLYDGFAEAGPIPLGTGIGNLCR
jgi:gentisate 1,2-dioxygenase